MKFIFIISLLFAGIAQAQVWEQSGETADNVPTDFQARPFVESDFLKYPWLKEFTNVVVINKSNEGSDRQTLRLFVNGKLSMMTKISSGRETFEKGCAPGQDPKIHHCSVRPY